MASAVFVLLLGVCLYTGNGALATRLRGLPSTESDVVMENVKALQDIQSQTGTTMRYAETAIPVNLPSELMVDPGFNLPSNLQTSFDSQFPALGMSHWTADNIPNMKASDFTAGIPKRLDLPRFRQSKSTQAETPTDSASYGEADKFRFLQSRGLGASMLAGAVVGGLMGAAAGKKGSQPQQSMMPFMTQMTLNNPRYWEYQRAMFGQSPNMLPSFGGPDFMELAYLKAKQQAASYPLGGFPQMINFPQ
eukprot:GILK01000579.1.p1 GENE.GILK01000579.1~~GILK01000579.1.p1  ORF type:complete len:260 (-),score=31.33 GILK01000579.1:109-855(-)